MSAITIEGLHKEFTRRRKPPIVAVDDLSFEVPTGTVFGFLGPNGSGKTTTIRCLLGITAPTRGRLHVLGAPVPDRLRHVARRVGSVLETTCFVPNVSARQNLSLLAPMAGASRTALDNVLERVGLAAAADQKVATFSLGMRQRLAIGAALLKDPEVLILDEPANGLDPAGIREIRQLLRSLAAEGRTMLVSSHLLDEVARTCDQVAVIRKGRCVAQGNLDDILALDASPRRTIELMVDARDAASSLLVSAGWIVAEVDGRLQVDLGERAGAAEVNEALGKAGIWASELVPVTASLEDRFLELTADDEPLEVIA